MPLFGGAGLVAGAGNAPVGDRRNESRDAGFQAFCAEHVGGGAIPAPHGLVSAFWAPRGMVVVVGSARVLSLPRGKAVGWRGVHKRMSPIALVRARTFAPCQCWRPHGRGPSPDTCGAQAPGEWHGDGLGSPHCSASPKSKARLTLRGRTPRPPQPLWGCNLACTWFQLSFWRIRQSGPRTRPRSIEDQHRWLRRERRPSPRLPHASTRRPDVLQGSHAR